MHPINIISPTNVQTTLAFVFNSRCAEALPQFFKQVPTQPKSSPCQDCNLPTSLSPSTRQRCINASTNPLLGDAVIPDSKQAAPLVVPRPTRKTPLRTSPQQALITCMNVTNSIKWSDGKGTSYNCLRGALCSIRPASAGWERREEYEQMKEPKYPAWLFQSRSVLETPVDSVSSAQILTGPLITA